MEHATRVPLSGHWACNVIPLRGRLQRKQGDRLTGLGEDPGVGMLA